METYRGRITIDGKGIFDYTLTPATGEASATAVQIPPAEQPRQIQQANGSTVVSVMLLKHEMKQGIIGAGKKREGETWVKHSFRGSDNRWYATFDEKVSSQLSPLVGASTPVKIAVKANNFKGFDVVSVLGS